MTRSPEQFKLNCERWSQSQPDAAALITSQLFKDEQIIEENADEWVRSQNLAHYQILFIYGVSGALYKALEAWKRADPERVIVFIEDNLAQVHHLFYQEVAGQMLHDRQARLIYLDPEKPVFKQFATSFGLKPFTILQYSKGKGFGPLAALISFYMDLQTGIPKEYGDFGRRFFSNYVALSLCKVFMLSNLHLQRKIRLWSGIRATQIEKNMFFFYFFRYLQKLS